MSRRYKRPDSLKHKRRRALREFHQKFRLLLKHRANQPVPEFEKGTEMIPQAGVHLRDFTLPKTEVVLNRSIIKNIVHTIENVT